MGVVTPLDWGLLAVGVLAVGASAPLITATAAPALAIAFWRNALGSAAILPVVLARRLPEVRRLGRREWLLLMAAGAFLAGHFGTWIPSLGYTSVASSVALAATQPVWAALIGRARGESLPGRAWLGMAVALLGVLVLTGVDLSLSSRALLGDLLAIAAGILGAVYLTIGGTMRREVSASSYNALCFGACALVLLAVTVLGRVQLTGFSAETWLKLAALTVLAQLLGHSLFNHVVRTMGATMVSLAILLEVPSATLIAAVWLGRTPPLSVLPAAALVLAGIALVVWSRTRSASDLPLE